MNDPISIRGAREHNLRGLDVDIPRDRLVVLCGVSGSGKSSLAFDTLFAEGQRRYVESLSAYARQFLGQMTKPQYDSIRGLTPTIAVGQAAPGRNPRSTVATLTEVHDYLRVLFARAGTQHCHKCGSAVGRQSAAEIVALLLELPEGTQLRLLAPVSSRPEELRRAGFVRVRLGGEIHRLDELDDGAPEGPIQVVVDRIVLRGDQAERISDAVETALNVGQGVLLTSVPGQADQVMSQHLKCHDCDVSFPELAPSRFSFNSATGMCQDCNGLGTQNEIDEDRVIPDPSLSIHDGAIEPFRKTLSRRDAWTYRMTGALAEAMGFDFDTPWRELAPEERRAVLYGSEIKLEVDWANERGEGRYNLDWEGVIPTMLRRLDQTKSAAQRKAYYSYMSNRVCSGCNGERICAPSAAVRLGTLTLPALLRLSVEDALTASQGLEIEGMRGQIAADLLREVAARLGFLAHVGLGYLALDRASDTLSGGEAQRIRLARQLGGDLTAVTYVLDEPTVGLHPRDTRRLVTTLTQLRDAGNTVVVVEHDRDTIEAADHVLDFGPGAGSRGGEIVYEGPPGGMSAASRSVTGQYMSGSLRIEVPAKRRAPGKQWIRILGARAHNLKDVDVELPLGLLVAITGVSGAGKSTLVDHVLVPALRGADCLEGCSEVQGTELVDKFITIDQAPIGRSPRSNPATYTKVYDRIRRVFAQTTSARVRGYGAGRFSFNAKGGRCEVCKGDGWRKIEMHFLADVYVPCEVCGGKRFNKQTLEVSFKGHNIAEVLNLTVDEALELFANQPPIRRVLHTLSEVGLGYLKLGQPATTLSGGEAQRIKLSRELARPTRGHTLFLLDEPTTGLHPDDVKKLVGILQRLVKAGSTVLVVEHDLQVVKCADHVVDLGPEGGDAGGDVVASGTPEEVALVEASHTGRLLGPLLSSNA